MNARSLAAFGRSRSSVARPSRARLVTAASLLAILALIAAAMPGSRLATAANAQPAVTIRISYQPILIAAPLLIAQAKGYFEKAGVNIELVELWQSSETLAGFAAGELQAA